MDTETFLATFRESLRGVNHPRFFDTERGYQGELLSQIGRRVKLPEYLLVEQEYQKNQRIHGLNIRPDIVIHEPFDEQKHLARNEGNFAVIELKLKASRKGAVGDFESLAKMVAVLRYPLGIFVNIGAERTYASAAPAEARGRIVCFGVTLKNDEVTVYEERI